MSVKWNIYLYTYNPVSVHKVAVVRAKDGMEALKIAHQHPRVKSREADGMEIRKADDPLNIKEFVEAEEAKQKGEGSAWKRGFKVGRPRKQARESGRDSREGNENFEEDNREPARIDPLDDLWFGPAGAGPPIGFNT